MNIERIQTEYLLACCDQRGEIRTKSMEKLKGTNDPDLIRLADVAMNVFDLLNGNGKKSDGEILQMFDWFPMTQNWRSLIEITGRMFLNKARNTQNEKEREQILYTGALLVSAAQNSGFQVTGDTIELLTELTKNSAPDIKEIVQQIIATNRVDLFELKPPKKPKVNPPHRKIKRLE